MMRKSKFRRTVKRSIRAVRPAGRKSSTARRGTASRKSPMKKTAEFLGI